MTIRAADHLVYTRRSNAINGEITNWVFDPRLRCQDIIHRAGPNVGDARFRFVPDAGVVTPIETIAADYHPDTQVRVEVWPYESTLGADTGVEDIGLVVFEGMLERQALRAGVAGGRDREDADFVALAMPWIDHRAAEHLITGRWVYVPGGGWDRVESPLVPAAFNYRGRGNMDGDDGHRLTAAGVAASVQLTARPFTHDDDPDGRYWTVREALRSLLAQWLYGVDPNSPKNRMTGVEAETMTALTGTDNTGRWQGLDDVLPETDVSGLRLFEAIDAVCRAAGFEFAVVPAPAINDADLGANATGPEDRRYLLRVWRRHAGPVTDLRLPKRGAFPANAATAAEAADVNRLHLLRDNTGVINHVFSRGRVLIEAGVELKPLWSPDDLDTDPVVVTHQLPVGVVTDTYHDRHVRGGSQFDTYGHVGRLWGIDCTGADAANYYTSGYYQHDAAGFDWLAFLGIDGNDPLTAERTARGLDAQADPIIWTHRVRRPLPLRRGDRADDGRRYRLEVSENAGSSWTDITDLVTFTVLSDAFGIRLTSVPNLASVNAASLASGTTPDVTASWYALIKSGQSLRFRLTCLVEADHAAIYRADRQDTSATAYLRGELVDVDLDEVWSHASSRLNTAGTWQKIAPAPGSPSDATDVIRSAAERLRDAREGARWSVGADSFLLRPDRYLIGDRVRSIAGRDLPLGTGTGAQQRHPVIVEVRWVLSGPDGRGTAQGTFLSLTDTALREGV